MKLRVFKILTLFVFSGLMFSGCATMLGGKSNTLVFNEKNLTKAEVFIDGKLVGEAPGKIKLPKEKIQHGSVLIIKADGYQEQEYLILRKQHTLYTVAGVVIGAAIPLAVDYTTGSIYRPVPRTFKYELIKE